VKAAVWLCFVFVGGILSNCYLPEYLGWKPCYDGGAYVQIVNIVSVEHAPHSTPIAFRSLPGAWATTQDTFGNIWNVYAADPTLKVGDYVRIYQVDTNNRVFGSAKFWIALKEFGG